MRILNKIVNSIFSGLFGMIFGAAIGMFITAALVALVMFLSFVIDGTFNIKTFEFLDSLDVGKRCIFIGAFCGMCIGFIIGLVKE